jgi:hypothetical protein
MAVYGEMLLFFPEQLREMQYFDMLPKINSGFTVDGSATTIWAVIQNAASAIKESNGNLISSDHMNVWTETKLSRGHFILFDGTTYRIVGGNDWPSEGGFYMYTVERVVGDNGTSNTVDWSVGVGGTPV